MSAVAYASLLILATVTATSAAVNCYSCSYVTGDTTATNAVLQSVLTSMTSGTNSNCADITTSTNTYSCSSNMCNYIVGTMVLTVGSESVSITSQSRSCHAQSAAYSSFNAVGCYDYDSTNPYAAAVMVASGLGGVTAVISGTECLCNTVLCNGAPVAGASVVGALLLALMSLVTSY